MGQQRNNPQMREKEEPQEKELIEIEASNLSDMEFKVMVIRMLKELSENYKELGRKCISPQKDRETINKKHCLR